MNSFTARTFTIKQMAYAEIEVYREQFIEVCKQTLGAPPYNEPWTAQAFEQKLRNSTLAGGLFMAISNDGNLIGANLGLPLTQEVVTKFQLSSEYHGNDFYIGRGMFVSPQWQGMGVGKELTKARHQYFYDLGYRHFVCLTNTNGPQLNFYKNLNYQIGPTISHPSFKNTKYVVKGDIEKTLMLLANKRQTEPISASNIHVPQLV